MLGTRLSSQIRDEYAVLENINLPEPGAVRPGTGAAPTGDGAEAEEAEAPAAAKAESRSATAKLIDAMPKQSQG